MRVVLLVDLEVSVLGVLVKLATNSIVFPEIVFSVLLIIVNPVNLI